MVTGDALSPFLLPRAVVRCGKMPRGSWSPAQSECICLPCWSVRRFPQCECSKLAPSLPGVPSCRPPASDYPPPMACCTRPAVSAPAMISTRSSFAISVNIKAQRFLSLGGSTIWFLCFSTCARALANSCPPPGNGASVTAFSFVTSSASSATKNFYFADGVGQEWSCSPPEVGHSSWEMVVSDRFQSVQVTFHIHPRQTGRP